MQSNINFSKRVCQLYKHCDLTKNAKLIGCYVAAKDIANISIVDLAAMCKLTVPKASNALFLLGVTGFVMVDTKVNSSRDTMTIRWNKDE